MLKGFLELQNVNKPLRNSDALMRLRRIQQRHEPILRVGKSREGPKGVIS